MKMAKRSFYNTILCQTFSPCGNYLVMGDVYGHVTVFNLQKLICPDETSYRVERRYKNTFEVFPDIQVNALITTENFLVVGTLSEILGYNWKHVTSGKDLRSVWKIDLPNSNDSFEKVEANCMVYNKEAGTLYAGCSDNKIYKINIEVGKIEQTLDGHTDYIHCLAKHGNDLISGSEDGLVNIWDARTNKVMHKLEPHKNNKLVRPEIGNWIGAVDLNDDWLLCGGGPRLSLWHYRSLNLASVFPIEDQGIHVSQFYGDKIFAGGRSSQFYQMNLNGDIIAQIPVSSVSIYSAVLQQEPFKALCLAGSSPNIDICSNFSYKDQVVTLDYDEQ